MATKGSFATYVRGVTDRAIPISFPFFVLEKMEQRGNLELDEIRQRSRERYAEPLHAPESDGEGESEAQEDEDEAADGGVENNTDPDAGESDGTKTRNRKDSSGDDGTETRNEW